MLWWRYQSPVHHFSGYFHHTSSNRYHQISARNIGSVCSYGTNKLMTHNSMHIKLTSVSISQGTNFSAYFRQGDPMMSSVMTSERKCECPIFFLSVLVHTDAIRIIFIIAPCTSQSHLIGTPTNAHNLIVYIKTFKNALTCFLIF